MHHSHVNSVGVAPVVPGESMAVDKVSVSSNRVEMAAIAVIAPFLLLTSLFLQTSVLLVSAEAEATLEVVHLRMCFTRLPFHLLA